MSALVEIQNLTRSYPGRNGAVRALDGVSLTLHGGDFIAVQGPSGCGKTTLLLAAGGLLQPTSGVVTVAGEEPYAMSAEARAQFRAAHIGFVFQQFHLIPYLSVIENILAPTLARRAVEGQSRARELAAHFGLEHRLQHVPSELSTGERQRTALARALLNRPKLLLADEPTGNLDRDNAEIVLGYLAEFAAQGGAVLLVTHDAAAAQRANSTRLMREGRFVDSPAV